MNHDIGYKYRGRGKDVFERDLEALCKNYFWAPNYQNLNDPCETLVSSETLKHQIDAFLNLPPFKNISAEHLYLALDKIINKRSSVGIYSLSTSYDHELLWAYYADSHKGFCIQYDLDLLIRKNIYQKVHHFPVTYQNEPPSITLSDISKMEIRNIFQKLFGTKSKLWEHEEEYRIITDIIGENDYDYSAVTAIYFGYRMPDEHKEKIMDLLKGRGIKYYQIFLKDKSYQFKARPIKDKYRKNQSYLFQLPEKTGMINYSILHKSYNQYTKKGTIEIQLQEKITEKQLQKIGSDLKKKLFRRADKVFMSYFLPEDMNGAETWATTHCELGDFKIQILGFSLEQEIELIKSFKADTRNIVGRWLDPSPFSNHGLILFKENGSFLLERKFSDGSNSIKVLKPSETNGGIRYDEIEDNTHGEYFIVDDDGYLHYFSKEEEFMKLKPYLLC
ncbi:MAG: DUF2971 domain-containing protein [Desulfobacter sp.]|nr:MAG: DUF2971 domain-containing protein [Desulfobacter sp.]